MKRLFYHCSVTGPGHIRDGLPNQDYVLTRDWGRMWIAVVCDGMGSRPHADIGAHRAAKAAVAAIKILGFDADFKLIVQTLYRHWLVQLKGLSIVPGDAVTTCILVWGKPGGCFRFAHLGDGMLASPVATISTGLESGFSNETTGLGISRSLSDWQFGSGKLQDHDGTLLLMTDGISEDVTDPGQFCGSLTRSLLSQSRRQAKIWLRRQLTEWPTPGHSDDKTVAVLCQK